MAIEITSSTMPTGTQTEGFSVTATVTISPSESTVVMAKIDGVVVGTPTNISATQDVSFSITDSTWTAIPQGEHSFSITATSIADSEVNDEITSTFTKNALTTTVQTSSISLATKPISIKVSIVGTVPTAVESGMTVSVSNNANDVTPTWEDMTANAIAGTDYAIANETKTADNWGLALKVELTKLSEETSLKYYISSIDGSWK